MPEDEQEWRIPPPQPNYLNSRKKSNLIRSAKLRPEMQRVFEKSFGGSDQEKIKRSILFDARSLPDDNAW